MQAVIKKSILTMTLMLSFITALAYDFKVDGIAYNVVSLPDLTCEVTQSDTKYSGDIVIPSTVTYQGRKIIVVSIKETAFFSCSALTSVEIPNSVTTIGFSAFYECSSLCSVKIPDSVTTIGSYAFKYCSSLKSIEIPNSITKIGLEVFYGCSSLTSVKIPNSVTEIGNFAFGGCSAMTSIQIPTSVTVIGEHAFEYCTSLTCINIPSSVTKIGTKAFIWCSSLTSALIPNSVTEIEGNAFERCSSLISIEIPNSITQIYSQTFYQCTSLASVEIPSSITHIGSEAFFNCKSLKSITIPNSVKRIDRKAFQTCHLNTLIWGSDLDVYFDQFYEDVQGCSFYSKSLEYLNILPSESVTIGVRNSDDSDFSSLKKLSLGKSLHNYSNVRWYLPNLSDLELTSHVKYFKISGPLKFLTIDKGVELAPGEYGADMSKFTQLECITMKGNVPQFIPTFANVTYLNAKLRVPKGTLRAYQNAEGWKNFWNIEAYEVEVGIDEVPTEVGAKTECGRYDLQGRPVDDTYRGVTIIRYTDGSAKKIVTTR